MIKIEIDKYAIRFHDDSGSRNFFFKDIMHERYWGHKVLAEIHNLYELCLIQNVEPQGDEDKFLKDNFE